MIVESMYKPISVIDYCKMKCDEVKDTYLEDPKASLVLADFGKMTINQMDTILCFIEAKFEKSGEPKVIRKRIFSIVAEICENIRRHGTKQEEGNELSFVNIGKKEGKIIIDIANYIDNDIVPEFKTSLQKLNGLTAVDLKKIYMHTLATTEISDKGGAGLGMITIAMKCQNQLSFDFNQVNNKLTLFTVQAVLNDII